MKDLHKRIKQARIDAGLSQQELAAAMKTSQTKISILESGGRSPKMATLMAIARACGMELNITFEPVQSPKSSKGTKVTKKAAKGPQAQKVVRKAKKRAAKKK